jgi:hypothetical protein
MTLFEIIADQRFEIDPFGIIYRINMVVGIAAHRDTLVSYEQEQPFRSDATMPPGKHHQ